MPGKIKRRRVALVGLALLLALGWFIGALRLPNPKRGVHLVAYAKIQNPELKEASGLVQSRRDPGVHWTHNDSGDRPRMFAVRADGTAVATLGGQDGMTLEGAALVDWEDIAVRGDQIFLCDVGNNLNRRRDLGVYQVTDPAPGESEIISNVRFLPLRYPDQGRYPPLGPWDFDCEAVFDWSGKLYFVTKCRPAFRLGVQAERAALYRLDSQHTDRVNVLSKIDTVDRLGGWITAADTSRDGRYLALLVESPLQRVWLYERPRQGDRFFTDAASIRRYDFHQGGQLEALAFHSRPDGTEEILLLNEGRDLFRLRLSDFFEP